MGHQPAVGPAGSASRGNDPVQVSRQCTVVLGGMLCADNASFKQPRGDLLDPAQVSQTQQPEPSGSLSFNCFHAIIYFVAGW
jgi:hypothetical protein